MSDNVPLDQVVNETTTETPKRKLQSDSCAAQALDDSSNNKRQKLCVSVTGNSSKYGESADMNNGVASLKDGLTLRYATSSDSQEVIELIVRVLEEYGIHGSNSKRRQHLKDLKPEVFQKNYNSHVMTCDSNGDDETVTVDASSLMHVESGDKTNKRNNGENQTKSCSSSGTFVVVVAAQPNEQSKGVESASNNNDNARDKIVATCALKATKRNSPTVRLERLYCDQQYRRLGIGKFLLQWAIQRARDEQRQTIELIVDKRHGEAIALYQRFGFIEWQPNGKSDNDRMYIRLHSLTSHLMRLTVPKSKSTDRHITTQLHSSATDTSCFSPTDNTGFFRLTLK